MACENHAERFNWHETPEIIENIRMPAMVVFGCAGITGRMILSLLGSE